MKFTIGQGPKTATTSHKLQILTTGNKNANMLPETSARPAFKTGMGNAITSTKLSSSKLDESLEVSKALKPSTSCELNRPVLKNLFGVNAISTTLKNISSAKTCETQTTAHSARSSIFAAEGFNSINSKRIGAPWSMKSKSPDISGEDDTFAMPLKKRLATQHHEIGERPMQKKLKGMSNDCQGQSHLICFGNTAAEQNG